MRDWLAGGLCLTLGVGCFSEPSKSESDSTSAATTSPTSGGAEATADSSPMTTTTADTGTATSAADTSGGGQSLPDSAIRLYSSLASFPGDFKLPAGDGEIIDWVDAQCDNAGAGDCDEVRGLVNVPGFSLQDIDLPTGREVYSTDGTFLAADSVALLAGQFAATLVEGGVFPVDAALFWTGGLGPGSPDCMNWSTTEAMGQAGNGHATGVGWHSDGGLQMCADQLPILCACWLQ